MSNDKLEDIKIESSAIFVIFFIGTIMVAFGEIDCIPTKEYEDMKIFLTNKFMMK